MNRYLYVAQIVLAAKTPGGTEDTVELITSDKAIRDAWVALLPANRIEHRLVAEGEEHTLPQVEQLKQTVIAETPGTEDDTCPCPECQSNRDLAELFRQMSSFWPPKGPGSTSTH